MAKDSVMKGWQIQRFGDPVKAAAILNQLRPLFDKGSLNRPRIAERYSLDEFVTAYNRVLQPETPPDPRPDRRPTGSAAPVRDPCSSAGCGAVAPDRGPARVALECASESCAPGARSTPPD